MANAARITPEAPAPEPNPPPAQPLFREEVLAERQAPWLGTVLLEPRLAHRVVTALAVLAALAVVALLVFGSYTRKARISGWLVPQQGLVRIVAPYPGVVTRVNVKEGEQVEKGAPLLVLSAELQSEGLGATREEIVRRVALRRDSLAAQKAVQTRLLDEQEAELRRRIESLKAEQRHLQGEISLQRVRVNLAERTLARARAMRARDLVAMPRLDRAEQEYLDQSAKIQTLERSLSALGREQDQAEGALRQLPLRRETAMAEIERGVAALEQELAEAESRRQVVVTAPQEGIVTGIQTETGSTVNPSVRLVSIVPTGSALQAQLFSPSRAIGFVRQGQRVLLRYQAFPYQKFGFYEGVVAHVSRSALSPAELPPQLAGLSNLYGVNEPVYHITVDLLQQTANAYGAPVPLQAGMQLEADVLIESRRLIEWMFEPLLTLTGKWHG